MQMRLAELMAHGVPKAGRRQKVSMVAVLMVDDASRQIPSLQCLAARLAEPKVEHAPMAMGRRGSP